MKRMSAFTHWCIAPDCSKTNMFGDARLFVFPGTYPEPNQTFHATWPYDDNGYYQPVCVEHYDRYYATENTHARK